MARLYSDEGFPKKVSEKLRQLDHDVLTVQEAGQANRVHAAILKESTLVGRLIRVNRPDKD